MNGVFTPDDALRRLLAETAIVFRNIHGNVVVLDRAPPSETRRPYLAIPSRQAANPSQASSPAEPTAADIIVTGSHIRGSDSSASPVTIISRTDLDRLGRATLAEAFATLPANFSGAASEQSALTLADGSGTNASLATGVNLRGLGAGATLVLVNGRRLAGSGTLGEFGDISSIPASVVDRVEILLDGASAIYGSDAVGGVVNIILKDRYEGADTRLETGMVTHGGTRELQAGQTLGTTWPTGSALVAYEYYHRDALASSARAYAQSADLRSLGGTDHRQFYSQPGNILALDPGTGSFGPAYAIPPGQTGTMLTPGAFVAGTVNLENQRLNTDLLPSQDRHSLYARVVQTIGDGVTLSLDGRYSYRSFAVRGTGSPAVIVATPANPFFVSPNGQPYDLIAYSFARELGPSRTTGSAATIGITGGAEVSLGHQWKVRPYLAFAQQLERNRVVNIVNTQSLAEALGSAPVPAGASYSTASDGFFNPFGDGAVNSAAILSFVGSGYQAFDSLSRVTTYNVDADGPLVDLPGGTVKLALGINVRREAFTTSGAVLLFTDSPSITLPNRSARTVEAAFAELRVPLVGPSTALPGLSRLDLTLAGRVENYSDFGATEDPKVGIVWTPAPGAQLRASFGTSFRAPNLRQTTTAERISGTVLSTATGQAAVILLAGGNPQLRPERADSWTAGIGLTPSKLPGVRMSATWFRTSFRSRIGRPALDDLADALINPALVPFVTIVSPTTSAADLARVTALINDPASIIHGSYAPSTIGAIVDARYVNTANTLVDGIDWTVAYTVSSGRSQFDLAATGTNLFDYREQLTPTAPGLNNVNLAGKPLALRGRLSSDWTRGDVGAGIGVNFANAYHDLGGRTVAAWATFDLQLRYAPQRVTGALHGIAVALNVQNVTDQSPPFVNTAAGVGYDAANADALGRFVSLQITKKW
ncbi:TonB-dependent receptor plug domain-containing protein [Glacieibacterium megasporae]|uniref:TonB-dependent receptor plug domain-containing protein n=1 Tax=Glacieibacterium megasporae TaxID=2835787 RepID=UPI002108575D|nr:TonB-dependent receptor [Polymorphobacter megasporae]